MDSISCRKCDYTVKGHLLLCTFQQKLGYVLSEQERHWAQEGNFRDSTTFFTEI